MYKYHRREAPAHHIPILIVKASVILKPSGQFLLVVHHRIILVCVRNDDLCMLIQLQPLSYCILAKIYLKLRCRVVKKK